ncbi:phage tail family protein [Brevibacterium sp. p3-SID960]|uniref:phage tail family protein n=1 Tax=Brevibacterium sp. p3-SID960 TaxID=2916063 RepID=UPI0021A821A8|nr:phage tail family protein [Brevibacterium sp. p3-SID960]MCT1689861.1 phage tail family protein [Brevibacterium sp. p3-SID960]
MWLEVTLKSSAGEIELSTVGGASGVFLLDGVRGFGLPEREIESTPLPAVHGSVFRSTRFGESEMMLPIAFRDENQSRVALRVREFERVLVPASSEPVELIVRAPELGTVRRRWCYYVDGLQGGLGGQDSHVWWRHCAVKLLALDPLWFGQTRVDERRVAAARKAFITGSAPRVERRNLHPNPRGAYGVAGFQGIGTTFGYSFADVHTSMKGGASWVSATAVKEDTQAVVLSMSDYISGPVTVSFDVLPGDGVGRVRYLIGGTRHEFDLEPGERTRVSAFGVLGSRRNSFHLFFYGPGGTAVPVGSSLDITDVLIEQTDTIGEFFDGDTPDTSDTEYRWEGVPGRSPSIADGRGVAHAYAFFPVLLSDSTVQGAYVLNIQGDADAWPVWEVTGPGEDLLIQNDDTGDRIFIEGQFGEKVTITTRPQEQDVVSASVMDGSLWERVSDDSVFFPLQPGVNRVRMSMVNGKPESTVTLKYVEQWMAGF